MTNLFVLVRQIVCAAALSLAPLAASAAEPLPLSVFGNLPEIERMALSHSGERLAAIMTGRGQRMMVMLDGKLDPLRVMPMQDEKVRSIEWIGEDHLLVVISQTTTLPPQFVQSQIEFFHAIIVTPDETVDRRVVFGNDPTMLNSIFGTYGVRRVDGRWQAFFAGVELERGARGYSLGDSRPSLLSFDVLSNDKRPVAPSGPDGSTDIWLVGADGKVAVTMSMQLRANTWQLKVPDGPVLARGTAPRGEVGLVALGRDGTTAIYQERNPTDSITRWFEVPLDGTGQPSEIARADEIERTFTDRATGHLIGLQPTGANRRPEFFDPKHQAAVERIYDAFPDLDVQFVDWAPDFSRVLVRTTGNGDSGTWYVVNMAQMRASAVGYERVAVEPQYVGAISTVAYKAGDGLDVDGILTLPPGRQAKNLPLVMLPHGGPHAHDEEVFDWWAQAFASRGYAVFQPNFRGSTNRDETFLNAGFGQWGRAMQSDISDGLAELARQGIVDPARACIVGASYGGYAALAGVTLQQGLYKCAVAVAPVSDLSSLFADELDDGGRLGMLRRSLLEELGPRSGFDAVSPRRFADRADAPILLIHGRDDTVVPFAQSSAMADALKDAGKPYHLVELRDEDHWMSRASTRLQMLEEAVAFVAEHNPPD